MTRWPGDCSAAIRCTSRRIHREMVNLPMAQSSTGRRIPRRLGGRHRAVGYLRQGVRPAGPPDAGRPLPRQAARLQHLRRLPLCPLDRTSGRSPTGISASAEGPFEDLDAFMNRRRRVGREPAGERHHGHEDLAVRSGRAGERRPLHLRRADEEGDRAVREDPQGGRRSDGHHGRVPFAVEPADGQEDRHARSSPTRRSGTRIRSG